MTEKQLQMHDIEDLLIQYERKIETRNQCGLMDSASGAEDLCCGLLNKMWDAKFQNMNSVGKKNYPAIDLADNTNNIGVQVTSTIPANATTKINHTIDEFVKNGFQTQYNRLIIVFFNPKPEKPKTHKDIPGVTIDVWYTRDLLNQIAQLDDEKLARVDEYLKYQLRRQLLDAPPFALDLPVRTALVDASFFGRQVELERIAEQFESNQFVFLFGLGGIGKTELAVRFARTRWPGYSYFVHFKENWRQTVLEHIAPYIEGLSREGLNDDRYYQEAMAKLRALSEEHLLILDNVNQPKGQLSNLRRELSGLKMRVLITTRTEMDPKIHVSKLNPEELHQLFDFYQSEATYEERCALIEAVNGHTLTVDLMARALRPGFDAATAEMLLHNLADCEIRWVETSYDDDLGTAEIIEHLKVVFNTVDLKGEERDLLRYATLLPDNGMEDSMFLEASGPKMKRPVGGLIEHGWLGWSEKKLFIHPVIRKVCQEELKPTDENCGKFLEGIIAQYDEKKFELERYRQMAELLTNASVCLEDAEGRWALEAGERWRDVGEFAQAQASSIRAMEKLEQNPKADQAQLALAINNVGVTYGDLGDHRQALEYQKKALEIFEKALPADHPDLALSYNNVGCTYGALGDHRQALEYKKKALEIREKALPADHPDLAASYNNVGNTYDALGDHRQALEYQKKALEICEKALPADHPDLALSYNNVGGTYGDLGDHGQALEYQKKALEIHEKALPADHPDLALSYNNVGLTYGDLGDHRQALEYKKKALEILKKVLPADHPNIATSCNNIAWTYYHMGKLQEAARMMRRAADIISRSSLPESHPNRINYPKWADELEVEAKIQQDMLARMPGFGNGPFPFIPK